MLPCLQIHEGMVIYVCFYKGATDKIIPKMGTYSSKKYLCNTKTILDNLLLDLEEPVLYPFIFQRVLSVIAEHAL